MENKIIVESKNDKIFIQALVNKLNIDSLEVEAPIKIDENDYRLLGGADPNEKKPTTLINALKDIKTEIIKKQEIKRIGVILDIDNEIKEKRFTMVNNAILAAFDFPSKKLVTKTNELFNITFSQNYSCQIACYFTNVNENGNLDTLLRKIANNENPYYAECLDAWRNCLKSKNIEISEFEYDKIWLSNYVRFDTCAKKDKTQAEKNCSMQDFDKIIKKNIFDLESDYLDELRSFIKLFKSQQNI
jgi:hypothetical protein